MEGMLFLWITVLIAAIIIEAMTMGLTSIWFAGGALAAILVERFHGSTYLQIALCLIVSLALLYFTRPIAVKYFNKEREKTNLDGLIGKQAVVTEKICNLKGTGKVIVSGLEWSAKSADDQMLYEKDAVVTIAGIKGVKLIIEPEKKVN